MNKGKYGPRPTNGNKVLTRLLKYIFVHNKISTILVVFFILLSSLAGVSSSLFLKQLIDTYITPMLSQSHPDFGPLAGAIAFMIGIYSVGILSTYIYNKILIGVSQATLRRLRTDVFSHMEKLPISYFDSNAHGDLMSIYTNDIDTLRQVISQSMPQFLSSIITIVSVFVSMLFISLPLSLIVIVMIFIMKTVTSKIASHSSKHFTAQQKQLGKENGYIEEMFEGLKVIKVFTHEEQVSQDFDVINESLFNSANKANTFANILMPVVANIGNLSYVFTALFGGLFAINGIGGLTLGGLASFLQLNRAFNAPMVQISQQLNSVIMGMAGAERVFNLLDQPVETDNGYITLCNVKDENGQLIETSERTSTWAWKHPHQDGHVELVKLQGDVEFHDVYFGYTKDKIILHDINLYAKPGEKVAFVGATGAGKTTITNLINRFYDIQKGMITYDGIDIKLIKKSDLRRSLGIVLQDTHLFSGTIRDNICYGNPNATEEEMLAASKLANAHSFIKHLEYGYDTILTSDGSPLSQGQRQLISIARAALANSPVLILDEATSSIDSRTEKIVQDGMDKLMKGRTVFVIAHRLSTIKNSDVIMVMQQGRIIERGNHDSLISEHGIYYQLYTGGIELD